MSLINLNNIPLSLYIHLPWCVRKCPYCDFNSHALRETQLPEKAYIDALLRDLQHDQQWIGTRPIHTIFFGGGTPSLFSGGGIARILKTVRQILDCANDMEITLEANPGAIEYDHFERYVAAGVNRLSLGVQSFNPNHLQKLGRIHHAEDAIQAFKKAQQAGLNNINLDLMFGLHQQSIDEALADLKQACDLNPTHISWYQLTLEPNTFFYNKPPVLPNDECIANMQQAGQALLKNHGYAQYEISAYARNQNYSRHNMNYWEFGDYLGVGAGAHGKITLADGNIMRTAKTRQPKDYLLREESFLSEQHIVSAAALPFEYLLNALRLKKAVSFTSFEQRTGLPAQILFGKLAPLQAKGLLVYDENQLILTELGGRFIDDILQFWL